MTVSWPAALLLSVCAVCVTVLVARGTIPSHAATMLLGAIVGYAAPRAGASVMARFAPRREESKKEP